jgi:hypothetical protein
MRWLNWLWCDMNWIKPKAISLKLHLKHARHLIEILFQLMI